MGTSRIELAALEELRVSFSGAFLTDTPIKVRVEEYRELQAKIGDALVARRDEGWRYDPLESATPAGSHSVGGGYSSLLPVVFVSREGPPAERALREAWTALSEEERGWLDALPDGVTVDLVSARIQLFEFGVGAFEAVFAVTAAERVAADRVIELVEALSMLHAGSRHGRAGPLALALSTLVTQTSKIYTEAVRANAEAAIEEPWLESMVEALGPDNSDPWGTPLWVHRLYMLQTSNDATSHGLEQAAGPFRSSFSTAIRDWEDLFVPGIDSSVLVSPTRIPAPDSFIPTMLLRYWAYAALLMETDRGLLATLDEVEKWDSQRHLSRLEAEARQVFNLHLRIERLLARLESMLIDFGGGGLALWESVAGVQRFGEMLAAIEKKLEILRTLTAQRVQEATAMRERRTNNILGFLTALTIVGLAVALVDGLFGTRTDRPGHIALRIAGVLVALLLAGLMFRVVRWAAPREDARRFPALRSFTRSPSVTSESDS